jgi:hypothetical protein
MSNGENFVDLDYVEKEMRCKQNIAKNIEIY